MRRMGLQPHTTEATLRPSLRAGRLTGMARREEPIELNRRAPARLASGPHPGEPTPQEVREQGTKFCVGTPADCIRFLELYEALGIEEAILLCAVGPAQHEEVLNTIRLFGEQVIPRFQARRPRAALARASA
jgi:alkanesulfonate monooxygenase SsuD/methylene tetrahydromethanopterin reductase-like flavin-dependent oxidoreductase (luciferase family)